MALAKSILAALAVALVACTLPGVHAQQDITSECVPLAETLASSCESFIQQAQKYGPQLALASQSEINSIAGTQHPSPSCCSALAAFYQPGCSCDPGTLELIAQAGNPVQDQQFATLYEAGEISCKWTQNYYPPQCPKVTLGPAPVPAPAPVPEDATR